MQEQSAESGAEAVRNFAAEERMTIEAARQLAAEDPTLGKDTYTLEVIENGGVVMVDGEEIEVDLGDFMEARKRILEGDISGAGLDENAIKAAMVVHSESTRHPGTDSIN